MQKILIVPLKNFCFIEEHTVFTFFNHKMNCGWLTENIYLVCVNKINRFLIITVELLEEIF